MLQLRITFCTCQMNGIFHECVVSPSLGILSLISQVPVFLSPTESFPSARSSVSSFCDPRQSLKHFVSFLSQVQKMVPYGRNRVQQLKKLKEKKSFQVWVGLFDCFVTSNQVSKSLTQQTLVSRACRPARLTERSGKLAGSAPAEAGLNGVKQSCAHCTLQSVWGIAEVGHLSQTKAERTRKASVTGSSPKRVSFVHITLQPRQRCVRSHLWSGGGFWLSLQSTGRQHSGGDCSAVSKYVLRAFPEVTVLGCSI